MSVRCHTKPSPPAARGEATLDGVAADDGIVTLTGYVAGYSVKLAAEKAVTKTFGVKAVAKDIVVKPLTKITDTDIATFAVTALESRYDVPNEKIKLTIKEGLVYLDGEVEWKFQKDAAEKAVSSLLGVKAVINRIELKPSVSTTDVKNKIEAAFRRSADVDARRISVTAHDGTVELWGNVRNWLEKGEAERAAWAAPGVAKVESHLNIVL